MLVILPKNKSKMIELSVDVVVSAKRAQPVFSNVNKRLLRRGGVVERKQFICELFFEKLSVQRER